MGIAIYEPGRFVKVAHMGIAIYEPGRFVRWSRVGRNPLTILPGSGTDPGRFVRGLETGVRPLLGSDPTDTTHGYHG